jgi:hypothetical protein
MLSAKHCTDVKAGLTCFPPEFGLDFATARDV